MLESVEKRMSKTLTDLDKKFLSIRTSRANPEMLSTINVDYYGSVVPLQQMASITVNEGSQFILNVFDSNSIKNIEKAILTSHLDLNPQVDGSIIRINLPELTEERRKDLVKIIKQYSEEAKVSIRNIRRDTLDQFKKQEKDNEITEDDYKFYQNKIQDVTERFSKQIDTLVKTKESDILTI